LQPGTPTDETFIGDTITVLPIMISVVEDVSRPTLTARAG
jgi:hypothetical protein